MVQLKIIINFHPKIMSQNVVKRTWTSLECSTFLILGSITYVLTNVFIKKYIGMYLVLCNFWFHPKIYLVEFTGLTLIKFKILAAWFISFFWAQMSKKFLRAAIFMILPCNCIMNSQHRINQIKSDQNWRDLTGGEVHTY